MYKHHHKKVNREPVNMLKMYRIYREPLQRGFKLSERETKLTYHNLFVHI